MQPGMARLMDELSRRYWTLFYAGEGQELGNRQLHDERIEKNLEDRRVAAEVRGGHRDFRRETFGSIAAAIESKDWSAFEKAYRKGVSESRSTPRQVQQIVPPFSRCRTIRPNGSISRRDRFLAPRRVGRGGGRMEYVSLGRGGPTSPRSD